MIENLFFTSVLFFALTAYIPAITKEYDVPHWVMLTVLLILGVSFVGGIITALMLIWAQ